MHWKKIVIAAVLVFVLLIAALYAFVEFYDVNKFKPLIAKAVKDATGRELNIKGDIDIDFGIRPTLVVEDVSFQNAAWSARPNLGRAKRLEIQVAVWPLILGKFDFAHLVLVEPEVIVEFDSAGTSNFSFDTAADDQEETETPPPPLIFSDVLVEKGLFIYKDAQSGFKFSVGIDHLAGKIPGFDKPLKLDFKGRFDDIPLTLNGTVGPIWAWVEPGYSLPADLTATSGGTTATISGELRDPINLKELAFDITAQGSSVAEIAELAGQSDVPKFGAFKLAARVSDPAGKLAVENLDVQIGSQERLAISLAGELTDVLALRGVNLNFTAKGQDSTQLAQFGLPALPEQGAFKVSAQISDPEAKVFNVNDLNIVLGENEVNGQASLNLAEIVPLLTTRLTSQKSRFGPIDLDLNMTDPFEKPAIKKIDLKLGTPELGEIRLTGMVADLLELQGIELDFQASGQDLANLKHVIGQPLPVRGAFSAAGKVISPVSKNLKIPDLKITAGKNNIAGSLNLDLRDGPPQLEAKLSLPKLDLPSVLLPELAKEAWAKGLGQVRPVKLDVKLTGFSKELAVKKVDLQAGTVASAELRLSGSVENLMAQRSIDLKFSLQGKELVKLKEIIAQPYIFTPLPGQGAYAISGKITDPSPSDFKVNDFKFVLADNELTGWLDFNLAAQPPQYEVDLSTPKFNLKPFPIPKEAAYARLNKIEDLGPLRIHSKVMLKGDRLSLSQFDLQAGTEQLAVIQAKGSIKNLTAQRGIDLRIHVKGKDVANFSKITGQSIPLKGAYTISGRLTDPAQSKYKLGDLVFKLDKNTMAGSLDLNLSDNRLRLAADFAAPNFTLQPVTLPALETLSRIEDLGPLKLTFKLADTGKKLAVDNLNFNLGRNDLIKVLLQGSIDDLSTVRGIKLEFNAKGNNISSVKKLGGPEVSFQGAFAVSGEVIDPAPKIYKIPSFNAAVGDSNQSGWLELDLNAQKPQLTGELSSDKLDLRPLFATVEKKNNGKDTAVQPAVPEEKKSKAKSKSKSTNSGAQDAKVFSAEPLPLETLSQMDVDLKIRNKQVLFPTMALNDVIANVLLKNGNLEIKPFTFTMGGGKADVQFALRSQNTPATLDATLDIDRLEIGPMLDQLGYQRSMEGNLDANFNLAGAGNSIAALMAGLNGNIRTTMGNGRASSEYLDLLEKYLGGGILRIINPFEDKRESAPVNCFVNNIEIKDGLADVKLLLDTDRTSIFVAGNIDLKTEKLDLGIKPAPKKGAMPADISFNLRDFSQPFEIGGTLAKPSLALDPGRTAFVIGKMAGALALGPIGIVAFFVDVSLGKKDPCAVAMESATQKDQPPDTKTAEDSSKETAAGNEKKKEKKSGGFFKRLFGK
ncbi:MAG: AsmA family protein [Desulfobacterales bacterium]